MTSCEDKRQKDQFSKNLTLSQEKSQQIFKLYKTDFVKLKQIYSYKLKTKNEVKQKHSEMNQRKTNDNDLLSTKPIMNKTVFTYLLQAMYHHK